MIISNATRQKKKKKNTAKLKASVTHGAPSSTHDAHASNDAQASQTMQKTSRTMRKASRVMKKHPHDAQSITCDAQASTRCPSIKDHLCKRKMTSTIPSDEPILYTDPKSNTCKRNRDISAEHQVPTAKYSKSIQSPGSKKISEQDRSPIGQQKSLYCVMSEVSNSASSRSSRKIASGC